MSTSTEAVNPETRSPHRASAIAPLEGIVVLDLTRWLSGPYAAMRLADAGATVIKVEPPGGDLTRVLRPILNDSDGSEVSGYFLRLNRRKKSVQLDLGDPDDRDRFFDLVRGADVILENYRPGVMDARGLGHETLRELNPSLIYCAISGFGYTAGPYRNWPAYSFVAEAAAAIVHWDDESMTPKPAGPPVGDLLASMNAVEGILLALARRAKTGVGSFVDISMYDSLISFNELPISWASMTGEDYYHGSTANINLAPYGFFPVADGHVCVAVATDAQWTSMAQVMGMDELADDERFATRPARVANNEQLVAILMDWLSGQTKHEVAARLANSGVPSAPVQKPSEILTCPQAEARGMIEEVIAPAGATWQIPASPITYDPPFEVPPPQTHAVGADNADLLV